MLETLPKEINDKIVVDRSGCWLWQGTISTGYGHIKNPSGSNLVHRIVYELLVGVIPAGLDIDHLCRVRHCCNPEHLEPVTRSINCQRIPVPRIGQFYCGPRHNKRRPFCEKGHPLSGDNLYVSPKGARGCMACRREVMRRHRERNPEEWRKWESSSLSSTQRVNHSGMIEPK